MVTFLIPQGPTIPEICLPRVHYVPRQAMVTPAFWDNVFVDMCPDSDAVLLVDWPSAGPWRSGHYANQVWAVCGERLPIGCRRAYFWYARRDQQSAVPDAVCRCAPIHLPSVPTHSRSLRVTTGILPTPTINCVWKHAAWDVTGPDATIQYLLFGAMFLIAVQRLPNDWLYVVRALPFISMLAMPTFHDPVPAASPLS